MTRFSNPAMLYGVSRVDGEHRRGHVSFRDRVQVLPLFIQPVPEGALPRKKSNIRKVRCASFCFPHQVPLADPHGTAKIHLKLANKYYAERFNELREQLLAEEIRFK
jgi:hypothetical protein